MLDFGTFVIQHEAAWLPIAVLRTELVKTIDGGFSCVAKALIQRLLIAPGNLLVDGAVLRPGSDAAPFLV